MKKDRPVAITDMFCNPKKILNKKLLPCNKEKLYEWFSCRTIKEYYFGEHLFDYINEISGGAYKSYSNEYDISISGYGISLMDNYWLIPISKIFSKKYKWNKINYFNNKFDSGIGWNRFKEFCKSKHNECSIMSPDATYQNDNISFFLYENNEPHLYYMFLDEKVLNEFKKNGVPITEYKKTKKDNTTCYEIKLYTDENTSFIPLPFFFKQDCDWSIKSICNSFDKKFNIENILKTITKLCIKHNLILDLYKIGFLVDNDGQIISLYPVSSFRPHKDFKEVLPFTDDFENVLKWCNN